MTMSDAADEARQLLAWLDKEGYPVGSWQHATVTNLLSHVERLTAPATGDRADAAADIRHLMLYEDPRSEDHAILERAAALLEADARLREACIKSNDTICQALGKALGYPWFKDDQTNFPGADESSGVCVGEHVAESIAEEAADRIIRREVALAEAHETILREASAYSGQLVRDIEAILAKVSAGRPDGGER